MSAFFYSPVGECICEFIPCVAARSMECEIERLNKIADANTKDYQQRSMRWWWLTTRNSLKPGIDGATTRRTYLALHRLNQENLVLFDHNTDRVIRMTQYVSDPIEVVAGYRAKC